MPSIGETLREARMRQRLDIADVEMRTKIRAKYLRALENEEFGMLPGPTFVKTFLRTYAEMLGLDPHVLVEEYRANYEGEDEFELQPLGPPGVAGRDRYRGPRVSPGALALLVLEEELEDKIAAILKPLMARFAHWDFDAVKAANRKQALIPEGAYVIDPVGTAPGVVVPGSPTVVVLPGPPRELQPMWRTAVACDYVREAIAGRTEYRQEMVRIFGV